MPAFVPPGVIGHNRSLFARNYAILPPDGMFPSLLPGLREAQVFYQATPRMGARFAQGRLEVLPGGGTSGTREDGLEHFLYILSGTLTVTAGGTESLAPGGFAYIPAGTGFGFVNNGSETVSAVWIKRRYVPAPGFGRPGLRFGSRDATPRTTVDDSGRWRQYLLGTADMTMDFEMNVMGFAPGTHFHCVETHIFEHGLVMLEGQGLQLLDRDWHELWAGDFVWMGSFVPQQFYCTGWEGAAYLLYKDVNRDVEL
ncbi:(S)-ureidoglycine aminohydrolase [Roseicella aerolata]|uniref:Cupin domain-containing protein n=1 Tax=Roseicella aerolata TaxID=2883479 RepID=A0A9X1L6F0_9PROT|nr:(S)-ureidoglycine aminohydrolase [Roseicella aerolata]MCB4820494.1 cupin domain-containing protein [Roseicella aerolata]